ncbi:MAG: hypothetical protein M1832_003398 [Thelocarpon impressellum]|nr:MAG: hypothetical protein M1832_003398 [Thelocarpon impressellum]
MSAPDPAPSDGAAVPAPTGSHPVDAIQPPTETLSQEIGASLPDASPPPDAASTYPQLSASTEEILKRVNAQGGANPGWEAAREQVLQRMVTSADLPAEAPEGETPSPGRGRGAEDGEEAEGGEQALRVLMERSVPVKVKTRARPRRLREPGGEGEGEGARKRDSDEEEEDDEEDVYEVDVTMSEGSDTPMTIPTKTKSGRRITAPVTFAPPPKSPTRHRRRGPSRRTAEASTCRVCIRGHSPAGNVIVFCDGCNGAWHQLCHGPVISAEVVGEEGRDWFCAACKGGMEGEKVGAEGLTEDVKQAYLTSLPHPTLVRLLLMASTNDPSLAIFPVSLANATSAVDQANLVHGDIRYPPPGAGLAARLPPENAQLGWLVDNDVYGAEAEGLSHLYKDDEGVFRTVAGGDEHTVSAGVGVVAGA